MKKEIDALSLPFLNINSRVHEKTRKLMGAKGPATCFITVPTSGCTGAEARRSKQPRRIARAGFDHLLIVAPR